MARKVKRPKLKADSVAQYCIHRCMYYDKFPRTKASAKKYVNKVVVGPTPYGNLSKRAAKNEAWVEEVSEVFWTMILNRRKLAALNEKDGGKSLAEGTATK